MATTVSLNLTIDGLDAQELLEALAKLTQPKVVAKIVFGPVSEQPAKGKSA